MSNPEKYPLLEALASDRRSAEAMDRLWLAAQLWLAGGGVVPMNRYLRLPATAKQLKIASRDLWLIRASNLLGDGNGSWAAALHGELTAFVSRGPWQSWRHLIAPPGGTSELRKALFFAMKFGGESVIEERQIYRVLSAQ